MSYLLLFLAQVYNLSIKSYGQDKLVRNRDVLGKEWEKMGTGKKRERNTFFPFPFLHFWAPVFVPFLAKIMKNG